MAIDHASLLKENLDAPRFNTYPIVMKQLNILLVWPHYILLYNGPAEFVKG